MKLRIASDIHSEFFNINWFFTHDEILERTTDDHNQILLLAGDVLVQTDNEYSLNLLKNWCSRFKSVYLILGNHDHYGKFYVNTRSQYEEALHKFENLHILEKDYVILDDNTALFGATLWTDFYGHNQAYMSYAEFGMNDYRLIYTDQGKRGYPKEPIDAQFTILEHEQTKRELYEFFKLPHKNKIVMTHHLPTYQSVADEYEGSMLNHAFASNLDQMIETYKPKLWIHGHTHHCFDYKLYDTRIICNPLGYRHETNNYNKNLVIEIDEER